MSKSVQKFPGRKYHHRSVLKYLVIIVRALYSIIDDTHLHLRYMIVESLEHNNSKGNDKLLPSKSN